MLSSALPAAAVLLSALSLVSAQTFTDCNPLEKTDCPTNPALGTKLVTDFTKGVSDDWHLLEGTKIEYDNSLGAVFYVNKTGQAPVVESNKFIFFGKVSAVMRAAPGHGIVSSFILESEDLDEIDWEWIGSKDTEVQSNFFGKGNHTTYDRGAFHGVATPVDTFRTYTIDWTKDYIKWGIDGNVVRTVNFGDAIALGGKNFPQTPMRVRMGNWIGCASKEAETDPKTKGTCEWADGAASLPGVYPMYVQSVTVEDYGCAEEYKYGDKTGSYQSIQLIGSCNGGPKASPSGSSTTSSVKSTTSGGVLIQSTTSVPSSQSNATSTLATVTSTGAGRVSSTATPTSSGGPAQQSTNAASRPHSGALDLSVVALGLGLGYLIM